MYQLLFFFLKPFKDLSLNYNILIIISLISCFFASIGSINKNSSLYSMDRGIESMVVHGNYCKEGVIKIKLGL